MDSLLNIDNSAPKVLLCESDDLVRKTLVRYLELANHWHVHGVGDGYLASQFLKIHAYDMVLSSACLDFVDGLELLTIVRKDMRMDIPFLLMTDNPSEPFLEKAFGMGVDDVLNKPIHFMELGARMKYHLHKQHAPIELI